MSTIELRSGTMDADIVREIQRDEYHVRDYVRPGDWVVDVGAYIGAFALHVKMVCPDARVLCLEPMPSNLSALRRNVGDAAIIEPIALVGEAGPTVIYDFGPEASACHSIYDLGVAGAEPVEVPGETLEQVLARHRIAHVRLLKLDCQGAEYDIVTRTSHDTLGCIDYIAMEVHHAIAKTGARLGVIPDHETKRDRLFRHLRATHQPVHGNVEAYDIQVWGNRNRPHAPALQAETARPWYRTVIEAFTRPRRP
jgi:FkbM family methyltransferase